MMFKKINKAFIILSIIFLCKGCVEEFEFGTQNFEDILVVEAMLTDELKKHEIKLSRTFRLEEEGIFGESNADVRIVDDLQNEYIFDETDSGSYVSRDVFSAQSGRRYQLLIKTSNGRSYTSETASLPQKTQIDNLYAERITNDSGEEGIGVFVDSFKTEEVSFYRYEYQETFKFISPWWSPQDVTVISENPPEVTTVFREQEERVCYITEFSDEILITNTNNFTENSVNRFLVRFIPRDDFKTRERYTIETTQYRQSREGQLFYDTLKEFSDLESLFLQTQPGFISGNVFSTDNPNEKVLGLFEVSSISKRRIFFDYTDFFPKSPRPPFIRDCELLEFRPPFGFQLIRAVNSGLYSLYIQDPISGSLFLSVLECGDCTRLGSNVVPDFWED